MLEGTKGITEISHDSNGSKGENALYTTRKREGERGEGGSYNYGFKVYFMIFLVKYVPIHMLE